MPATGCAAATSTFPERDNTAVTAPAPAVACRRCLPPMPCRSVQCRYGTATDRRAAAAASGTGHPPRRRQAPHRAGGGRAAAPQRGNDTADADQRAEPGDRRPAGVPGATGARGEARPGHLRGRTRQHEPLHPPTLPALAARVGRPLRAHRPPLGRPVERVRRLRCVRSRPTARPPPSPWFTSSSKFTAATLRR